MKYGELQYRESRTLEQPNIIIGRSHSGDWIDQFDQPRTAEDEGTVPIEGEDALAEYLESCLERFEKNEDIQAGLVALQLWHHYRERWGKPSPTIESEIVTSLLEYRSHNVANLSYLHLLANEISRETSLAIRSLMIQRLAGYASINDLTRDRHFMAYLEATASDESLNSAVEQLQALRHG